MRANQNVRTTLRIGWAALAVLLLTQVGCAVPQPRGGGVLERLAEPTTKRGYYLYTPKPYKEASESERRARHWPTVVTLHGMRPFDIAWYQAVEWQQEADRYGFFVIAPDLEFADVLAEFPVRRVHPQFKRDEMAVLAVMDHVFANTSASPRHVLSTGFSSGGYMAHYLVNQHPDRFSALAPRQANFAATVMNQTLAAQSRYHPVLVMNTQNDFKICKEESREAIGWYQRNGYQNVAWVYIKDLGHERTPDIAADFFAKSAGVQPLHPPAVLAQGQAIDGNAEGLAMLQGKHSFKQAPGVTPRVAARPQPVVQAPSARRTPPRRVPAMVRSTPETHRRSTAPAARPAARTVAVRPATPTTNALVRPNPVSIRLSSAIGIEPLHLAFSAACPSDWYQTATFEWTLDGRLLGRGVNGQRTITRPGEYRLGLTVTTREGQTYRVTRSLRVLPEIRASQMTTASGS